MKTKNIIIVFIISALIIGACAKQSVNAPQATPAVTPQEKPQPEVNIPPPVQNLTQAPVGIASDVKDLLAKYKTKATSIHYNYKGPETADNFYAFFIKGSKIKYLPSRAIKTLDKAESWDTIYLDASARTAASYCEDSSCLSKGKKSDLNFNDVYIATPYDWLNVKDAAKTGEEIIDDRQTWKLETDKGITWVDTYYGIPSKAKSGTSLYYFKLISANDLDDSDVNPK
ncbi:MAG TPA: hypothetical protein VJJ52_07875 [Candidatus Nanoarchaeia archaeon]|nr:hypothetical protein [Candidatus Nanoarchaeia archaeon]